MHYTYHALKYVLRNFLYILPLALFPALFLALSMDVAAIERVVSSFFHGKIAEWNFIDLFLAVSILNFGSWRAVVFGLLGIVVVVPCVALMMAWTEKHFRIGKRTFNGVWSRLNDNFVSTLGYVFLLLFLYELWALLTAAVLDLLSFISIPSLAYVLLTLAFVGMHVLLLWLVGCIYLWTPCMQMTGFRALEALQYAYQLFAPVRWRVLFSQFFSVVVAEVCIGLCVCYCSSVAVSFLVTSLLYLFLFLLFCVRMQIVYFDRDQIERADLRRY